jgi:hypothetical protein
MSYTGPQTPGMDAFERMRKAIVAEQHSIASDLLRDAKADAPQEMLHGERHANLAGSGKASVEEGEDTVTAVVEFTAPQAIVEETHREYKHPIGGKAGYLGDNVIAMIPRFGERLARAARRSIGQ